MKYTMLPAALVGSAAAFVSTLDLDASKTVPKEQRIAQQIVQAKENLKEHAQLHSIQIGGETISNENQIASKDITKIIVPSTSYSQEDILKLNKYHSAVLKYFETNDPSVAPTCANLGAMTPVIISQTQCEALLTKEFSFFEYNNGTVAYATTPDIASYIDDANTLEQNATTTLLVDKPTISKFSMLSDERKSLRKQAQDKETSNMLNLDPLASAKLSLRISYKDATTAIKNAISTISHINTVGTANDTKKEIAKIFYKILLVKIYTQKQESITISDATNKYLADEATIKAFVDTHLTPEEKLEILNSTKEENADTSSILYKIRNQ